MTHRHTASLLCLVSLAAPVAVFAQDAPQGDPELRAICEEAVSDDKCVGLSVAVMRGDEWLLAEGFGIAELEHGVPADRDTVFRIGSVTKQFTSAAVMRLVEQGKVELDADFRTYLPDYPDPGTTITVRHLLTHTSGIPSYTGMDAWRPKIPLELSHDEMLAFFSGEELEFMPGSEFEYNNSGYYLLGMLIEEVTGESYADHVGTLCASLGLSRTRYGSNQDLIPNRAQGYEMVDGELANDALIGMSQPGAAGALLSTAENLVRWARALAGGEVVSDESYRLMTTAHELADGSDRGYGFGLMLGKLGKEPQVAHGGGINGFNSFLAHYPESGVTVAVISNCEASSSSVLAKRLARKALRIEEEELADLTLEASALSFLLGKYEIEGQDAVVEVTAEDGKVRIVQPDGQERVLMAQSDTEMRLADNTEVAFVFDGDGARAAGFSVMMDGVALQRAVRTGEAAVTAEASPAEPELGEPVRMGDLPVTHRLPAGWESEPPSSSMRLEQYAVAPDSDVRCVVFWFGAGGGGGRDANLDRWIGQFSGDAEVTEDFVEIAKNVYADVLYCKGAYVADSAEGGRESHDDADWTMLASYLDVPDGPLFIKFVGPSDIVEPQREAFMAWLRSFRGK